MTVSVRYWSWFKDLAGLERETLEVEAGVTLGAVLEQVRRSHPKFEIVRRSTLVAVGVDYQDPDYRLQDKDEISLFPPVQGG